MDTRKVASNFIWRMMERFGAQIVTSLVALVLARLLDPAVYGTVALVTVVTAVLQVFVDSGLGNALIQKKDADELDFSTVFFFNLAVSLALYLALFAGAPLIAAFYGLPELTSLIRVLGLSLIISGVKNIQQAYVSRHLLFRNFFFSTLGGTLGAAVVGVWMALRGYGVWALAGQWLFNGTVDTLILWVTVKWRPKPMFSLRRLRGLFSYGWKLLAANLLDTIYQNLRQLIIGKRYSTTELAFFNRGMQFPAVIVPNITTAMGSVLFPVMSAHQDDRAVLRSMARRAIRTGTFLIWPAMVGLAICGEPLVRLVLTEKWMPCLPFLYIFCLDYTFWPVDAVNIYTIRALGRSGLLLKLDIAKRLLGLTVLLLSIPHGVPAVAACMPLVSLMAQILDAWPNRKLLHYTYGQQLLDSLPAAGLSLAMGVCVWCVRLLELGDLATLLLQVPLGVAVYLGGAWVLQLESFTYLLHTAKQFLKQK